MLSSHTKEDRKTKHICDQGKWFLCVNTHFSCEKTALSGLIEVKIIFVVEFYSVHTGMYLCYYCLDPVDIENVMLILNITHYRLKI